MTKQATATATIKGRDLLSPALKAAANNAALKLAPSLHKAKLQAQRLSKSVKASTAGLRKFGGVAGKVVGIAGGLLGGLSIAAFASAAKSYVSATDALAKYSKTVGLTATQVSALTYAGERNGIATDTMKKSLQRFNLNLAEAKNGTGSFASFLDRVSPSLKKTLTGTKDTNEAFRAMVSALSKVQDPAKRALLASEAFGKKAGSQMALLGQEGTKGLDKLISRYEKYNGISNESAKEAEELADAFLDFEMASKGVKNSIMGALLPSLLPIIKATSEWIAQNKDLIKSKLVSFLSSIGQGLKALKNSGALGYLKTLATSLARSLMPAISVAISVFKSFWSVLRGPLQVAFRLAMASFSALGGIIKHLLGPAIGWVSDQFLSLVETISDSGFGRALGVISNQVISFLENFDKNLGSFIQGVKDYYQTAIDWGANYIASFVGGWKNLKIEVGKALDYVWVKIKSVYSKLEPYIEWITKLWGDGKGINNPVKTSGMGTPSLTPALANGPDFTSPYRIQPITPSVFKPNNGTMNGVVEVRVSSETGSKATVIQAVNRTDTSMKLKASTGQRSIWGK